MKVKNDEHVFVGDNKLCAGGGIHDTCNGDSGGPLLSNKIEVGVYCSYSTEF
jgi:secreted trypsin-like serine protease